MATWEDVRRLALALPESEQGTAMGTPLAFRVRGKLFVWKRPLGRRDLESLGDDAPNGEVLGARVEHLGAKEALLSDDPEVFFTIPHFDGYAAILARLERIPLDVLEEIVTEAWLCRAPKRLVQAWERESGRG